MTEVTAKASSKNTISLRICMVLISLFVIASDNRFWMFFSTWRGGSYTRVGIGLLLICIPLVGYILHVDKSKLKAKYLIPCSVMLIMVLTYYRFGITGISVPTRLLVLIVFCYVLLCLNTTRKIQLMGTFTVVFSALMFLGLLYYVLRWIGLDLTTAILESPNPAKTSLGQYYSISPLGVLLNKRIGFDYCGYFDESGCLGTFIALILVAAFDMDSKDDRMIGIARIVLLIEGVLTLSFAFFLIMGAFLAIKAVETRRWPFLIAILGVFVAVLILQNVQLENETLIRLQTRLGYLFNGGGSIDNRLTDAGNMKMREFFNANSPVVQLFGFGPGEFSAWQASSGVDGTSVYYYLYDRGYVGMALYFLSFVLMFLYASKSGSYNWTLLLMFALSTYQRPEVFSSIYMTVLILGSVKQAEKRRSRKRLERTVAS